MKESVAIAKAADAKKGVSPIKTDNSIPRLRNEPEMQIGSLRGVIGNIKHDGGKPSVESIAAELSGVSVAQRASALLALQQTHGNRYVQRVVSGIPAKLVVGQPWDIYEQEADEVMRMPEPGVQRQAEKEEVLIQTKPLAKVITPLVQRQALLAAPFTEQHAALLGDKKLSGHASQAQVATTLFSLQRQRGNAYVQKVVECLQNSAAKHEPEKTSLEDTVEELQQQKGSGQPLGDETREEMEQALGYDLGGVRLHTDSVAHKGADALGAKAFTMDTDIFFSQKHGSDFSSPEGKRLLTHELTHVVQQSQGNPALPGDKVKIGEMGDAYENEADAVANRVVRGVGTARTSAMPIKARGPSQVQPQYPSEEEAPERREELPLERPDTAGRIIQKVDNGGGVVPLAPTVIRASAGDVVARVNAQRDNINGQIQTMVDAGIMPLIVGTNTAAHSFENWWTAQSHPTSDTAFWCDVAGAAIAIGLAVVSVLTGGVAAVTIAAALISAESSVFRGEISRGAGSREAQARAHFSQCALNFGEGIRRGFQTFGDTHEESDLWWDIAIDLTAEPSETARARETLHAEAGVPRPDRPYAELMLTGMINGYLAYQARRRLGEAIARPPGEVEISEEAEEAIARRAASEAQRQLGVESAR